MFANTSDALLTETVDYSSTLQLAVANRMLQFTHLVEYS